VATSGPASLDVDGSGVIDDTERGFFCEMTREGGGWTRVFLLDNTQPGFACPPEWRTKEMAPGIVGCERPQGGGSQPGIALRAPHGFNEVMGRVVGVVFGDQDAFSAHSGGLDDIYVDGVSLTTRTVGAREHVFTFVGGHPLDQQTEQHCPCEPGGAPAPAFVDRFFCDRASAAGARPGLGRAYDIGNPMWDGPGDRCAPDVDGYFARATLTPHTAEDGLELRIMSDQPTDDVANADENVALVFVDLYVR
jgi:hypothetical protein